MLILPHGLGNGNDGISDPVQSSEIELKEEAPTIPYRQVLKELPSGEIRIERGADGAYLLFDCDCLEALPYCHAQCCSLKGIVVLPQEEGIDLENSPYPLVFNDNMNFWELQKGADGYCNCLNRETRRCNVYDHRPATCREFHCTRGHGVRGWKLPNQVIRHSIS